MPNRDMTKYDKQLVRVYRNKLYYNASKDRYISTNEESG